MYSIALVFGKSAMNSYQDSLQKPMEDKNSTSQRIFLKFAVLFDLFQIGGLAGAESKQKSTGGIVYKLEKNYAQNNRNIAAKCSHAFFSHQDTAELSCISSHYVSDM